MIEGLKTHGEKVRDAIVKAIVSYIEEHKYPPTVREIGDMVGLKSTASVFNHLMKLQKEGRVETDAGLGSPRSIRIPGYKFVKEDKKNG